MKNRLFLLPFLLFFACTSDDDQQENPTPPATATTMYIANEGGFNAANSSLTVYDPVSGVVSQDVYANANDGDPLGDIFQSISEHNEELYFVINNSSKIEVVNATTYERTRTITGMESPRYMYIFDDSKAYVSDLFESKVHIVNPTSGAYSGSVTTTGSVEKMLLHNDEIWATNNTGDKLIFINPNNDQEVDNLILSDGPGAMAVDPAGDVWVFCEGFSWMGTAPALYKVGGQSKEIITSFEFDSLGYANSMGLSPNGQSLYYLYEGDVFRMSVSATELPVAPFISGAGRNFYKFYVHPVTGVIAVTDAADFSSESVVYMYNANGVQTAEIPAGIIPSFVHWKNQ